MFELVPPRFPPHALVIREIFKNSEKVLQRRRPQAVLQPRAARLPLSLPLLKHAPAGAMLTLATRIHSMTDVSDASGSSLHAALHSALQLCGSDPLRLLAACAPPLPRVHRPSHSHTNWQAGLLLLKSRPLLQQQQQQQPPLWMRPLCLRSQLPPSIALACNCRH